MRRLDRSLHSELSAAGLLGMDTKWNFDDLTIETAWTLAGGNIPLTNEHLGLELALQDAAIREVFEPRNSCNGWISILNCTRSGCAP